jgi:hypothetical protein
MIKGFTNFNTTTPVYIQSVLSRNAHGKSIIRRYKEAGRCKSKEVVVKK